jgi:hypothetical protein
MAGFGQTQRVNIAKCLLNNTALAAQGASLFVSLHTASPGPDGQAGNEVSTSGTAYARQPITFGTPTSADPSVTTSTNAQTYAAATGSGFGTITHFGIWNSSTLNAVANFIGAQTLTGGSQVVGVGNIVSFASGAITHTFTG